MLWKRLRWKGASTTCERLHGTRACSEPGHANNAPRAANRESRAARRAQRNREIESTTAAAERVGARIVFPGTVYNYAPDTFPRVAEDAPQAPVTRKGKIRVEMERRLEASKVRVLIVRASDFFGPRVANCWFGQRVRPVGATWTGRGQLHRSSRCQGASRPTYVCAPA